MQDAGSPRCTEGVSISAMKLTLRSNLLDVLVLQDDGAAGRSRNIDGDLVKSRQLFFGALAVGDIEETRNVLEVLTTLSLDDRILATSNRGEVALESTKQAHSYQQEFPCHGAIHRRDSIPCQGPQRFHVNTISLKKSFVLADIFISIETREGHKGYNGRL